MKNAIEKFHYTSVLSVTDGRLISNDGMGGVYNVIGYVVGHSVMTHELPGYSDAVKAHIFKFHPDLGRNEVKVAIGTALANWRAGGKGDFKSIEPYLNAHVLALMPSEYLEFPPMENEEELKKAEEACDASTEKLFGDKPVINVVI